MVWPSYPIIALLVLGFVVALQSSIMHEVLHGHPTRNGLVNEASLFLPIGIVRPSRRFKALHLRHHADERLTDPFDDPESCYKGAVEACKSAGQSLQAPAQAQQHHGGPLHSRPVAVDHRGLLPRRHQADGARATAPSGSPGHCTPPAFPSCGSGGRLRLRHSVLALRLGAGLARSRIDLDPHLRRAPMVGAAGRTHDHRRALAALLPVPQQQPAFRPPPQPDGRLVQAAGACSASAATNGCG